MATVRNKLTPSGKYQALYMDHEGKRRTLTDSTRNKALKAARQKEAEAKLKRQANPSRTNKNDVIHPRPYLDVVKEYLDWGAVQGGRNGTPWGTVHARNRKRHLNW